MGERMTKKNFSRNRQLVVKFSVERSHRNRPRQTVLSECLPLTPKHVSRKLIQYNDHGQRALGALAPMQKPPVPNRRMHVVESIFDGAVNLDRWSIPKTVTRMGSSGIGFGVTKPVRNHVERLVRVFRHRTIVPNADPLQAHHYLNQHRRSRIRSTRALSFFARNPVSGFRDVPDPLRRRVRYYRVTHGMEA